MTQTREFTRQELETLGVPRGLPKERVLLDEVYDTMRWSTVHQLVFRSPDDEQIYEVHYKLPATVQDVDYWNDEDSVTATRVEQRIVFRREWRPVGSPKAKDEADMSIDEAVKKGLGCAVCHTAIFFQDAPTGGWWIHAKHPADDHDAVSLMWGQDAPPWVPESEV